jgi:hypothetical protein
LVFWTRIFFNADPDPIQGSDNHELLNFTAEKSLISKNKNCNFLSVGLREGRPGHKRRLEKMKFQKKFPIFVVKLGSGLRFNKNGAIALVE